MASSWCFDLTSDNSDSDDSTRKIVSPLGDPVEPKPQTVVEATQTVSEKLQDLDYSIDVLLDALNEVAKIHPIIAGL